MVDESRRARSDASRVSRVGSDAGASAVEYALMLAGIAALIVVTVFLFGIMVNDTYVGSCNDINDGVSANIGVSTDCGG
jgi:pilus assembly protein Flp/PilA